MTRPRTRSKKTPPNRQTETRSTDPPTTNRSEDPPDDSQTNDEDSLLALQNIDRRLNSHIEQTTANYQTIITMLTQRNQSQTAVNTTPAPANQDNTPQQPTITINNTPKYECVQTPLNQTNFNTWFTFVEAKIHEWKAGHLIDSNEVLDEDIELNRKVFLAIYSNITDDVKNVIILKDKTVHELISVLKEKYQPYNMLMKQKALSNLRKVHYFECDIVRFSENFIKQINELNRDEILINDQLARLFYINNFTCYPQYKTILIQFEQERTRNKQPITLRDLINHANINLATSSSKSRSVDIDANNKNNNNKWKNHNKRYTDNRRPTRYHPYKNHKEDEQVDKSRKQTKDQKNQKNKPNNKPNYKPYKNNHRNEQKSYNNSKNRPNDQESDSDDEPAIVKSMRKKKGINGIEFNNVDVEPDDKVIDTGADGVACRDIKYLHNIRECDFTVKGFNGSTTRSTSMGDMDILLDNGIELSFKDVLHIPGMKALMYISADAIQSDLIFKHRGPVYIVKNKRTFEIGTSRGPKWLLRPIKRYGKTQVTSDEPIDYQQLLEDYYSAPPNANCIAASNKVTQLIEQAKQKRKCSSLNETPNKLFKSDHENDPNEKHRIHIQDLEVDDDAGDVYHVSKKRMIRDNGFPIEEQVSYTMYWHIILGHPSETVLKSIMKKLKKPYEPFNCQACNFIRLHKTIRTTDTNQKLEIVYMDLFEIDQPCWNGDKYVLTIVDDWTEHTTVYTMQKKSQTKGLIQKVWLPFIERQGNSKVLKIVSDNGGEFIDKELIDHIQSLGIVKCFTVAHTHHSNGVVERKIRTLRKKAELLLSPLQYELSSKLYNEAVKHGTYLINYTPYGPSVNICPNDKFFERKTRPDLTFYFGEKVNAMIGSDQDKIKIQGIYVGQDRDQKGHRVYFPKKQTVKPTQYLTSDKPMKISRKVNEINGMSFVNNRPNQNNTTHSHVSTNIDELLRLVPETNNIININNATHQQNLDFCEFCLVKNDHSSQYHFEYDSLFKNYHICELKFDSKVPTTVTEALESPDAQEWISAMKKEYDSMLENDVFDLVEFEEGMKVLKCKTVFAVKTNAEHQIIKYKARFVATGYQQKYGIDYEEVFAPTLDATGFRILLAFAIRFNYYISTADVTSAYLNAEIDRVVYMDQPEYFRVKNSVSKYRLVWRLKKGIYGLKQSGRLWNKKIVELFMKLDLYQLKSNSNIFRNKDASIIIGVYVDDIVILARTVKLAEDLINDLQRVCKLKLKYNKTISDCLGMRIERIQNKIVINQVDKIEKLAERCDITKPTVQETPIKTDKILDEHIDEPTISDVNFYQSIIGELLYIARMCRPDIQVAVNQLSRFNVKPKLTHLKYAIQTAQYLFNTRYWNLVFEYDRSNHTIPITICCDSDFANDIVDRKSFSGYCIFFDGMLISWSSTKQSIVALSTNEAEIIAANESLREAIYIRNVLSELTENRIKMTLYTDNKGVIKFGERGIGQRTKHLDLRLKHLYDWYHKKLIALELIESKENPADLFTKFVNRETFKRLRSKLNLVNKRYLSS